VNWEIAANYLLRGKLDQGIDTFFSSIEQILAGTAFIIDLQGHMKFWKYWSIENGREDRVDDGNLVDQFCGIFDDSVRIRMRSDVPVGVCLSGGLDSTSIICQMANVHHQGKGNLSGPIEAFCFMSEEHSEKHFIDETLKRTGAILNILDTNPIRLFDRLKEVLGYHDEPFHTMTTIVSYELMELVASKGIKVVLNGQGADESLAGYESYFLHYWCYLLRAGKLSKTWQEIKSYSITHSVNALNIFLKVGLSVCKANLRVLPFLRNMAKGKRFNQLVADSLVTPELASFLTDKDLLRGDPTLEKRLKESIYQSPLPLYLRVEDRNSMAHSVETRLPFLDFRLISFVFKIPQEWKMCGAFTKYILRESMKNRIPETIRIRTEKMGFPTPVARWFRNELYERVRDILSTQDVKERGIYKVPKNIKEFDSHKKGEIDISSKIFRIVQFELWADLYKAAFR